MNKTLLITLLASTLTLSASVINAATVTTTTTTTTITTTEQGKGYSKHKDAKSGQHHQTKRHGKHRSKKHGMMKRMIEKLELTDAQQAELKTLRTAQKAASAPLRQAMKALRTEMKALDTTSADYTSQVIAIADKKANLTRQRFIQKSTARQQFKAVFTTEQLAKMKAMKAKYKGKHDGKGKMNKGES